MAKALAPPPPNTPLLDPNAEPAPVAGIAAAPNPPLAAGVPNPPAGAPNAGVDTAPNPVPPLIPFSCVCVRQRGGGRKARGREGGQERQRRRKRVGERERKRKGEGREVGRQGDRGGREGGTEGRKEGGRSSSLTRASTRGRASTLVSMLPFSPICHMAKIKCEYVRKHHARARTPGVRWWKHVAQRIKKHKRACPHTHPKTEPCDSVAGADAPNAPPVVDPNPEPPPKTLPDPEAPKAGADAPALPPKALADVDPNPEPPPKTLPDPAAGAPAGADADVPPPNAFEVPKDGAATAKARHTHPRAITDVRKTQIRERKAQTREALFCRIAVLGMDANY